MTEEIKPKGTPYGLAMGLLHEFAESLPRAVVLLPDHVLWPSDRCGAELDSSCLKQLAAITTHVQPS